MLEPIQKEYRKEMNALARGIDNILNGNAKPKKVGFVLMVFPFGEEVNGRFNYISNGARKDIVVLMKEMIAKFEGQPDIIGRNQ